MKTFTIQPGRMLGVVVVLMVAAGLFTFTGCEKCEHDDDGSSDPNENISGDKPIVKNNIVLPFFVEGANQEWWANLSDNDVIYEERMHNQILGPDGHPVTWGEFNRASGDARINCTGQGTRVNIHLEGLIPNGVYSLFLTKYSAPGFDTTFANISGFGAAGKGGGDDNTITASSRGDANFHVSCPAGPLSVFGSISGCIPSDEYELHFVGIYHLDGQAHGASPGPAGTYVENFDFIVSNH